MRRDIALPGDKLHSFRVVAQVMRIPLAREKPNGLANDVLDHDLLRGTIRHWFELNGAIQR